VRILTTAFIPSCLLTCGMKERENVRIEKGHIDNGTSPKTFE
jgi:hypothetical protein